MIRQPCPNPDTTRRAAQLKMGAFPTFAGVRRLCGAALTLSFGALLFQYFLERLAYLLSATANTLGHASHCGLIIQANFVHVGAARDGVGDHAFFKVATLQRPLTEARDAACAVYLQSQIETLCPRFPYS